MADLILGLESSCDECSAALVSYEPDKPIQVLNVSTFSQTELHRPYGGVVPEIASRNHLETINERISDVLRGYQPELLSAIAVTNRPGLVGALLVGVTAAKSLAYAWGKPLVAVHHLEGHAASLFLEKHATSDIRFPLCLAIISGGHTQLHVVQAGPELWPPDFLSRSRVAVSRDDAAGEAFDKTAKMLGFPYPGGVWIDKTAQKGGKADAFRFPRALPKELDFSFSGLKTAVALEIQKLKKDSGSVPEKLLPDLCASIQEAIVDAIWDKIARVCSLHHCRSLAVVGGVAANSRLRDRMQTGWKHIGLAQEPLLPELQFCTDNGAMIAAAGAYRFRQGQALKPVSQELLSLNAFSGAPF